MTVIYRGRRHLVAGRDKNGLSLKQFDGSSHQIQVSAVDPDLILRPSDEDLELSDAYERGEIGAFEYDDGHTYRSGLEIGTVRGRRWPRFRSPHH